MTEFEITESIRNKPSCYFMMVTYCRIHEILSPAPNKDQKLAYGKGATILHLAMTNVIVFDLESSVNAGYWRINIKATGRAPFNRISNRAESVSQSIFIFRG